MTIKQIITFEDFKILLRIPPSEDVPVWTQQQADINCHPVIALRFQLLISIRGKACGNDRKTLTAQCRLYFVVTFFKKIIH